jgi:hypothetical protein
VIREATDDDLPPSFSPNQTAFDARRRRLLFADSLNVPVGTVIQTFDLATFRADEPIDVTTAVPGFTGAGMTYSPADDRLYLIGTISAAGVIAAGIDAFFARPPVGTPVAVVALEAASGALAWIRPVPQCIHLLADSGSGSAFIGRSSQRNALYFFCTSGGAADSANGVSSLPGFNGLVRVSISPGANQQDVVDFPVELFPVSGSFTNSTGAAQVGLDHPSDRVFIQSVSPTTPGAWTFDGAISAWVGLIAAPNGRDLSLGINERTGHYYIGSTIFGLDSGYLVVSNARMTPPPQGDVFDFPINGSPIADAGSRRIFVPFQPKEEKTFIAVLEDRTSDPEAPEPVDYDDLTLDIAEGPGTFATYASSLNGFGTRAFLVGGIGGASSSVSLEDVSYLEDLKRTLQETFHSPVPALSPGDRGIYLGRVASVDLRDSGATASAQAAALDTLTDSDLTNSRDFVATTPAAPSSELLRWPYPAASCLDGSGKGESDDRPGTGGRSTANCDLAASSSDASSSFHPLTIGPLMIGSSSFTGSSRRDKILGAITESTSIARGIELSLEGIGSLSIGRVTAISRTVAHGRPGTARVEYTRRIQDVTVTDASGEETFSCQATCEPEAVADAVNETLGVKIRMDVPPAELIATPRGAFAGVEKSYRDFIGGQAQNNDSSRALPALQLTINNDSSGKSRLLVQLAAIQANSTYGISLLPALGGEDVPPSIILPAPPLVGVPLPPNPPAVALPPGTRPSSLRGLRGAFLLARSPRDAVVVGLIFAVIGGAIASAYRRQMLLQHLEDDSS